MLVDATISQLRTYCPILAGRVAGAADFAEGLKNYNATMVLPAAYVVPVNQEAGENSLMNGLLQVIRKSVAVVVEFDARADRRGQVPTMNYDAMEACLMASLLNWKPVDPCRMADGRGMSFDGGRFLDLDRARVFYQWEFGVNWMITDEDGFQPPSFPLSTIEVDLFKAPANPGDMPAVVIQVPTGNPPYPPATDGPWPTPPPYTEVGL